MNLTCLYVLALYAIAVWLAHRAGIELRWRIAALFYVLTLIFLLRPMTTHTVSFPTDVLQLIPPWKDAAVTPLNVSNYELQDVTMQMVPWAHEVRTAWRSLRVPLWTELAGCGYPLLANMQSAALSPLRLLALPLPLGYAMTAEAAMKILIGLTFTFLFCRRRGYDEIPSAIGAACFGFGTFLTVWLHFPHSTVAAFLPAVLHQIDLLAERITFGRFAFAATLGAIVVFGGHPETAAHMLFFATLYALWVAFGAPASSRPFRRHPAGEPVEPAGSRRNGRRDGGAPWQFLATLAAAGAVAILLALPLLAPFAETLTKSMRYQQVRTNPQHGIPYSDFPSLVLLAQPRFYGTRPQAVPWGPATAESICGFAGILGIGAWFGLLAKRKRDSRETFFILVFALLFLLLADFAPLSIPFQRVFAMAANARLRLPFSWLAAVMTAAVLHHGKREIRISIAGAAAVLVFILVKTNFPNEHALPLALVGMIPSLVVLAIAGVGQTLLSVRPDKSVWPTMLIGIALVTEIWLVTRHWNPVRPLDTMYPRTPLIASIPNDGYRMIGIGEPIFPNTNMIFGLADARVHDPMAIGRYLGLLRVTTKDFDPSRYYAKWNDTDTPLLDDLNVKWVATAPGVELDRARYRLAYDGADGRLYENTHVRPRFFAANAHDATTRITSMKHADYRIAYDAPRHALIVSSIPWWRGWRITRDGQSLRAVQVNGAFLGFVVPPGHGEVRVHYFPMTFWLSSAISIATLIALVIIRARCLTPPGPSSAPSTP